LGGNPFTALFILEGEPANSLKRKILATAFLVFALQSGAYPTTEDEKFTVDNYGVITFTGSRTVRMSPLEVSRYLETGLLLLAQELAIKQSNLT
jgi:hypothetical protein